MMKMNVRIDIRKIMPGITPFGCAKIPFQRHIRIAGKKHFNVVTKLEAENECNDLFPTAHEPT